MRPTHQIMHIQFITLEVVSQSDRHGHGRINKRQSEECEHEFGIEIISFIKLSKSPRPSKSPRLTVRPTKTKVKTKAFWLFIQPQSRDLTESLSLGSGFCLARHVFIIFFLPYAQFPKCFRNLLYICITAVAPCSLCNPMQVKIDSKIQ